MIIALYLLLLSIINAPIRGASKVWYTSKGMAAAYAGILTGLLAHYYGQNPLDCGIIAVITWLGLWLGFLLGWGAFLGSTLLGWTHVVNDKVAKPFRYFADKFVPVVDTAAKARKWGAIGFTTRAVCYYPTFIALSYFNPLAALFGLLVFTKGLAYLAVGLSVPNELPWGARKTRIAEYFYPLVGWGLSLTLTIVSM